MGDHDDILIRYARQLTDNDVFLQIGTVWTSHGPRWHFQGCGPTIDSLHHGTSQRWRQVPQHNHGGDAHRSSHKTCRRSVAAAKRVAAPEPSKSFLYRPPLPVSTVSHEQLHAKEDGADTVDESEFSQISVGIILLP